MRLAAFFLFLAAMSVMSLGSGLLVSGAGFVLCALGAALVVNRQLAGLAAREADLHDVRVRVVRWNY